MPSSNPNECSIEVFNLTVKDVGTLWTCQMESIGQMKGPVWVPGDSDRITLELNLKNTSEGIVEIHSSPKEKLVSRGLKVSKDIQLPMVYFYALLMFLKLV